MPYNSLDIHVCTVRHQDTYSFCPTSLNSHVQWNAIEILYSGYSETKVKSYKQQHSQHSTYSRWLLLKLRHSTLLCIRVQLHKIMVSCFHSTNNINSHHNVGNRIHFLPPHHLRLLHVLSAYSLHPYDYLKRPYVTLFYCTVHCY